MAHRHAGGLDGHAAVTGSKAAAGGRLAEGLRSLELGALGRQLQVEIMFEPEHGGRLHRVDEEALCLVGPVLHLDLDGDAVRLVQLLQGPVVQAEPLVLLDGRAELLGQLVVRVRIDGDRLRQVVCQPREMLSGLGVARRSDGQDAHGVGASLFEAVAEETVVAPQPVSTEQHLATEGTSTYIDLGQQSAYPGRSGISSLTPVASTSLRPLQTFPAASVASNSPESSCHTLRRATSASVTVL